MMRFSGRFWTMIAAVAIVAMVSQVAMAQREKGGRGRGREGGPGGRGGPPSMARLATIEKVQAELKLSDEQKEKIKKINDDSWAEMRKQFDGGGRPDREKMRKMRDDTQTKVDEVLDEGQRKRLIGIFVQVAGPGAVMDPAVGKEIGLSDEQKTKLREAMGPPPEGRGGPEGRRPEGRPPEGREGRGDNRSEMREKMEKEVMAVLTPEQQKKLDSLKGEKVEIDMSELRGPGGGREGRGERRDRGKRDGDESAEKKASA